MIYEEKKETLVFVPNKPKYTVKLSKVEENIFYNGDILKEEKVMYTFLNSQHKTTFQELRSKLAEYYRFNSEYLSVCFIMAGNPELLGKMEKYFDGVNGGLYAEEMFAEQDFSSGLNELAKLAVHLFNNNMKVSPLDLIQTLDDEMLQLAINAILFRRYGIEKGYPGVNE